MRKRLLVALAFVTLFGLALGACASEDAGQEAPTATTGPSFVLPTSTPTQKTEGLPTQGALPTVTAKPSVAVPSPTPQPQPQATAATPSPAPEKTETSEASNNVTTPWWQPKPLTTWQIQLNGEKIDTSYDVSMYIVDLFLAPPATIQALRDANRQVMCYFNAGIYENWRDDAADYPQEILGNPYLLDLDIQRWVDIRALDVLQPILERRLDLAVQKGCTGILPAGMNGYTQDTGFPLTAEDQLAFNRWLAQAAHDRKLSIGLMEDDTQVKDLVDVYDWAYTESCFANNACDPWRPFVKKQKAVFDVEYDFDPETICPQGKKLKFSVIFKGMDLGGWQYSCLAPPEDEGD